MTDKNAATTPVARRINPFDVRFFISIALGLIGIFLIIVAIVADPEYAKTGGVHANLWTGIAMLVVSIGFAIWARFAPMLLPAETPTDVGGTADPVDPGDLK
jgi:hypothetical protein